MRTQKFTVAALVALASLWAAVYFSVAAAADEDQYVGTWKGSWEGGGGSGRFDMTFARGSDGQLTASVAVGTDMGDYNAKFSKAAFVSEKFTGAYDYPPDVQGEVIIQDRSTRRMPRARGPWVRKASPDKPWPQVPGKSASNSLPATRNA